MSLRVNNELEKAGIPHNNLSLNRVSPSEFHSAIMRGKAENKHGWKVDLHTEKEYKNMRLYLTSDGKAGIAIKRGGDVVSVFSSAKGSNSMGKLIPYAIALGGRKLDCFGDKLAEMYARYGAKPTGRVKFDDNYAPDGWDGSERPDVYAMTLPSSLNESIKNYKRDTIVDANKVKLFKSYGGMIKDRNKHVPKSRADYSLGLLSG